MVSKYFTTFDKSCAIISGDADKGFACELLIEDTASLVVSGNMIVTGDNPVLTLEGSLTADSLTIDNRGTFTAAASAKLFVSSLTLSAWSVTTVTETSQFGNDITKIGIDTLHVGYEANLTFAHSELTLATTSLKIDSLANVILEGTTKNLTIITVDLTIQDGALINLNGGGLTSTGTGSSSGLEGASYGGVGGANSTAQTYGSSVSPVDYGSGTGSVRGGGVFHLTVTGTAEIDGSLLANGDDSTTAGGGSGGSIFVEAGTLQGHGKLKVDGGKSTSGGGGGGGRTALIAPALSAFLGEATAYGGNGVTSAGAAGTVYQEYSVSGGSQVKKVIVDNKGQVTESFSHINGITSISELEISGYSQVRIDGTSTYAIGTVTGDYTGTLTVSDNQVMDIATSYGTLTPYALKCKLIIEPDGKAEIPSRVLLTDDDSTGADWYNLEIYGTVIGVRELTVSSGGQVLIHSLSRSGLSLTNLEPVGTLGLNKIDVTTNGVLELSLDSMDLYTLSMIKEFNVKYGGQVQGRNLYIKSPSVEVAYGGLLHVNGGNKNTGTAAGASGTTGAGGSHGGTGGESQDGMVPLANYTGDFTAATEFGSAGGDGAVESGAHGGGYLNIEVATLLTLHGTISSDGNEAATDAGGGSGGAVLVTVTGNMKGSGSISVKGGNADNGGGGGGGRIRVQVDGDFEFLGTYDLCGGSTNTSQAGGSGTAVAKFQQVGTPGYVTYLYIDNSCSKGVTEGVTFIDLPGFTLKTLNNLNIGDKTKVWLYTPGLHFKAKTLTCGTGSTMVIGDNTVFSPDFDLTFSAITCSFDLKQDGELRLPNSVELKGESSSLEGNYQKLEKLILNAVKQQFNLKSIKSVH